MDSWLPTQEELLLMDMEMDKQNKNGPISTTEFKPGFCFPTEFPYEFDSLPSPPSLNSPLDDSPTETESSTSDEDDFLTGLTRRLTQKLTVNPESTVMKKWVMAGSPESTLSAIGSSSASSNGSPNGVLSPAATPFGSENDTWDLIYAAAGQIARLKMNSATEGNHMSSNFHGRGFSGHVSTQFPVTTAVKNQNPSGVCARQSSFHLNLPQNSQNHGRQISVWEMQKMKAAAWVAQQNHHLLQQQIQTLGGNLMGFENGRSVCPPPRLRQGLPQSDWVNLQLQQNRRLHQPRHHQQQVPFFNSGSRTHFLGGSGVKRESTGTGVFLPRRYGNTPDSKKNSSSPSACSSFTFVPPQKVAHPVTFEFDDVNMKAHHNCRRGLDGGFLSDCDALMAGRRNGVYGQQRQRSLRQEGMVNHEMRLPGEWTY